MKTTDLVRWFSELSRADIAVVGGKNASLGEMITTMQATGIRVPAGFATTAAAYWYVLEANGLAAVIATELANLDADAGNVAAVGAAIRERLLKAELPSELVTAVTGAYRELAKRSGRKIVSVAVRSSATAEDLPEASFAGQLETFLNVRGEKALLEACKRCYASLFTDRAIVYRRNHGFDHMKVALS
ncbi:MAG: PEP/pyruvate-binding domain-containing protein, partial [Burkholderiales bacterium]